MIGSSSQQETYTPAHQYFGKYRGRVVNNIDPQQRARIQVDVSDVAGFPLIAWALPCVPAGGFQHGLFSVPPINSGVWIEFERGDIDYPIWTGCYWGSAAEVPNRAKPVINRPFNEAITLQTPRQHSVVISDLPAKAGGIQIKTTTGVLVHLSDIGIEINTGAGASITMIANTITIKADLINFNDGALLIKK